MRRSLAIVVAVAALLAAAPPAAAKGPWRITVRGPGVVGEVDLMQGPRPVTWILDPATIVGRPGPARPGPGRPYVVTWYSAVGWDTPAVTLIAVHFDTGAVEVLDSSIEFVGGREGGWFEANEQGLRELERVIDGAVAVGKVGAFGYEFVSTGTDADWVPMSGRSWLLAVLATLAGLRPW